MLFQIKGRFDGLVKCEVEIPVAHNASESTKLGKAVLAAISKGANLGGANLGGANLRSADLYGANLDGANLDGANLRSADLGGANLGGANLGGANLRSADLYGANLDGANLDGADLCSANLDGANLRSADLRSANLYGANLRSANLYGANLGGEVGLVSKWLASVSRGDGYTFHGFVREDGSLGIAAGCQLRTLASYQKHIADDYPNTAKAVETQDILDFLARRHAAVTK